MTTENSVRVPREPTAEMLDAAIKAMLRTGIDYPSELDVDAIWEAMLAAAPAPAGAEGFQVVENNALPPGTFVLRSGDQVIYGAFDLDATPTPEQGAGLAELLARWETEIKEAGPLRKRDLRPQRFVDDLQAALAHQRARAVDEAMVTRFRAAMQDEDGFYYPCVPHYVERALRAALEGGRDGR